MNDNDPDDLEYMQAAAALFTTPPPTTPTKLDRKSIEFPGSPGRDGSPDSLELIGPNTPRVPSPRDVSPPPDVFSPDLPKPDMVEGKRLTLPPRAVFLLFLCPNDQTFKKNKDVYLKNEAKAPTGSLPNREIMDYLAKKYQETFTDVKWDLETIHSRTDVFIMVCKGSDKLAFEYCYQLDRKTKQFGPKTSKNERQVQQVCEAASLIIWTSRGGEEHNYYEIAREFGMTYMWEMVIQRFLSFPADDSRLSRPILILDVLNPNNEEEQKLADGATTGRRALFHHEGHRHFTADDIARREEENKKKTKKKKSAWMKWHFGHKLKEWPPTNPNINYLWVWDGTKEVDCLKDGVQDENWNTYLWTVPCTDRENNETTIGALYGKLSE